VDLKTLVQKVAVWQRLARNPNILQLLDVFQDDHGNARLVFELFREPLPQVLTTSGAFDQMEIQTFVAQALAALHFVHGKGLAMGTLSPSCFFVTRGSRKSAGTHAKELSTGTVGEHTGTDPQGTSAGTDVIIAKLGGFANALPEQIPSGGFAGLVRNSSLCTTALSYRAPEVLFGLVSHFPRPRADMWSFGCICIECVWPAHYSKATALDTCAARSGNIVVLSSALFFRSFLQHLSLYAVMRRRTPGNMPNCHMSCTRFLGIQVFSSWKVFCSQTLQPGSPLRWHSHALGFKTVSCPDAPCAFLRTLLLAALPKSAFRVSEQLGT